MTNSPNQNANFKAQLKENRPAFGCWIDLFSPLATEIIAQAGYDCILIDLEHGPGSVMDAIAMMQAAQGSVCAPLIRVPDNDPVMIKRVLDAGVAGVMVPSVNSVEEATAAVAACRYPPRGKRGAAMTIVRASGYGARWQDYAKTADDSLLIMCQIESGPAVAEAAAIAAADGVDMLFIGPMDLSASLGHLGEPDHPEVQAMIATVAGAAKAAGKLWGTIPTPGRSAEDLFAAGCDLVLAGSDISLLRNAAQANVAALRKGAGRTD